MGDRWPGALISEIIACKDRMKKQQIPYDASGNFAKFFLLINGVPMKTIQERPDHTAF